MTVVGGGGTVLEWDGAKWVRTDLGDAQLQDVEVADVAYTVGGGGAIFRRDGGTWAQEATPIDEDLRAVPDDSIPPRLRSVLTRFPSALVLRFTLLPGHTTHTREGEPERLADSDWPGPHVGSTGRVTGPSCGSVTFNSIRR